jgi:hypothetical protein
MDVTFISPLRVHENSRSRFERLARVRIQYARSLSATIERGCSIGANRAQNNRPADLADESCDLGTQ